MDSRISKAVINRRVEELERLELASYISLWYKWKKTGLNEVGE